jgi:hypothetical protein
VIDGECSPVLPALRWVRSGVMRSTRLTLVPLVLVGVGSLGACGGGDDPVGFDDLDATREGFSTVTEAAFVEAGEDAADSSVRNRGLILDDCLILDDDGWTALVEASGATEGDDERRVGALYGLPDSQQTDCSLRGEGWETPLHVAVGTTTLTKDQLASRLGDDEFRRVVDAEIDGVDADTTLIVESAVGRGYMLVDDDFFVRLDIPAEVADEETQVALFEVAVAEVERTLQR